MTPGISNDIQCHEKRYTKSGLPQSGKKKSFQDHGKVREFCCKLVKMSFFEKVRENQSWSGNFFYFLFLFGKFSSLNWVRSR